MESKVVTQRPKGADMYRNNPAILQSAMKCAEKASRACAIIMPSVGEPVMKLQRLGVMALDMQSAT